MPVRAPRSVLIVEDYIDIMEHIESNLREMGFEGSVFDPNKTDEPTVLSRTRVTDGGTDYVYLTRYRETAELAAAAHPFAQVFADSLVASTNPEEKDGVLFEPVMLDILNQPQNPTLFLITGDTPRYMTMFLKSEVKKRGLDMNIDEMVNQERIILLGKSPRFITQIIGRFLETTPAVQPGQALDRK
jgi:hypothetical protein